MELRLKQSVAVFMVCNLYAVSLSPPWSGVGVCAIWESDLKYAGHLCPLAGEVIPQL